MSLNISKKKANPKAAFHLENRVHFITNSRLAKEPNYRAHLRSRERLGVLFIPLGHHGLPHTACEVHLFAEVQQGSSPKG